ncbi:ArsR/SmtB family transcription factor [Arthrobacter sp. H14]|uniref:ArsR/SmtB family transcription factor n=1 Tax=Arthrobacter sp. H14 TaxID=1312959 RepID=UPI00068433F5|nr:metalloregulator ArsR/SmtB family transcription factor [Arthrobacter sp. H14]
MNTATTVDAGIDRDSCCTPVGGEAMSEQRANAVAHQLKALADPTRLRLISLISSSENSEACVCDLTEPVGLGQPTVSHHLKILVDAGLLSREKRGIWSYYSLVPGALESLAAVITP